MREEEAGDEANRMKVHAKGLILSHALLRMTAPSAEGAFWNRKSHDEKTSWLRPLKNAMFSREDMAF